MSDYKYILEKGSKKHGCPQCSKRRFVRYLDTFTGEYLPDLYGRCDRESKCSYHLNPHLDGYAKMIAQKEKENYTENWTPTKATYPKRPIKKFDPVCIPFEILDRTRSGYERNGFIQNLLTNVAFPFDVVEVEKVVSLYHLGTIQNGYRSGSNTFPFIDEQNGIRTVQVKQFDTNNHTTGTDFLHSIIEKHHTRNNTALPEWLQAYKKNETRVSCLFGSHLLNKYPNNPIALVEAPKTAIYATLYFGFPEHPENLLWLAVYNLSSLNLEKCKALKGKDVYLFPDLSKDGKAFELWSDKARTIEKELQGTTMLVSDLLERYAPNIDKENGKDLADYLIQQDWHSFRTKQPKAKPLETLYSAPNQNKHLLKKEQLPKVEVFPPETIVLEKIENWESEIIELEVHINQLVIPEQPIKLNPGATIINIDKFIKSHLATVKTHNGKHSFLPYLNRLQKLKQILTLKNINI